MISRFSYTLAAFFILFTENGYAQRLFVPAADKHIVYEGRIAFKGDAAELMWSGSSVSVKFTGSGISAQIKEADTANYYNVIIDNDSIYKIRFDTTKRTYKLAANLLQGKHTVKLFKRTEWVKGKTSFYGFELEAKTKLLKPSKPPKRKIEFYGNSITCGFAVEDSVKDTNLGYYENNYVAYPAITARHFNAQYHCIAKSGIGIMISWAHQIMPEMYDLLDPTDSLSKWDFAKYRPNVVVINLLQNDSYLITKPDNPQFKYRFGLQPPDEDHIISSYANFVKSIRTKYSKAYIICMLGSMDVTKKGSAWPGYVKKAVASLQDKRILTYFAPFKATPGHPKVGEQQELAQGLMKFIEQHIAW